MTHPLTPLYLQRSASRLRPSTRCLLDFIAQSGPCRLDTLCDQLRIDRLKRASFRFHLVFLAKAGYLEVSGYRAKRRWQIGFGVEAAAQNPDELALSPAAQSYAQCH
ncbi:hypothetical protein [Polaromonas sp.]|uniref:hypothetical protein n=1 Tax=Polaromonas sp. TaxID=1869339 RepID=UPI003BB4FCAE